METWTKTGPIPGGLILTHTQVESNPALLEMPWLNASLCSNPSDKQNSRSFDAGEPCGRSQIVIPPGGRLGRQGLLCISHGLHALEVQSAHIPPFASVPRQKIEI